MSKRSKRYKRAAEKLPEKTALSLEDAIDTLKKFDSPKFDETVELCVKLGIDTKQANQGVRGAFSLPHGIGKSVKVICFAEGAVADEAKEAGASEGGSEDLAKRVQDGWLDFDVAVAHPSMMRHVGKLGRILGPHGKMPTPKAGTVTEDIGTVVKEFVAGKIEYRNDDTGNLHVVVGKKSFDKGNLIDNVRAFLDHLPSVKPMTSKGAFIVRVTLSTTMGPGVPVKLS